MLVLRNCILEVEIYVTPKLREMKSILIILGLMLLVGCYPDRQELEAAQLAHLKTGIKIIEIDSCEYVVYHVHYAGGITHKGNCKYCEERKLPTK